MKGLHVFRVAAFVVLAGVLASAAAQTRRGEVVMENRTNNRMIWLWIDGDKKCAALMNLDCRSEPAAGEHQLDAKDNGGRVIKSEKVKIEGGRVFTWTVR